MHPIKGFDGKCVSDKGNSSANRTKIIIWNCSSTDQAENWKFSNNEFIHNGKCMNDQGNGGIRSNVILCPATAPRTRSGTSWPTANCSCRATAATLCLDDPRSSTTNGTQLILYTCTDSANQKWNRCPSPSPALALARSPTPAAGASTSNRMKPGFHCARA